MAKNAGILSKETLERIARIIHDEAIADRECQVSKRALTEHNKDFCALNAFKRIDGDGKGWINSLDLVQLFQENGKVIPEMDTYMLVNAFDSNDDGRLSLMDISKLLSPVGYYGSQN